MYDDTYYLILPNPHDKTPRKLLATIREQESAITRHKKP